MKIIIDSSEYTDISDLKVVYETDVFAYSYPISKLTVRIKTTDNLSNANLLKYSYSMLSNPMSFFVKKKKRVNDSEWEIEAESWGSELDKIQMPAAYYAGDPVDDSVQGILNTYAQCFYNHAINDFRIYYANAIVAPGGTSPFSEITVLSGIYFPSQSLRERLVEIALLTNCVIIEDYLGVILKHVTQLFYNDFRIYIDCDNIYKKPKIDLLKLPVKVCYDVYTYTQKAKGNISSGDRYVIVPPMKIVIDPDTGVPKWEKDTSGTTKYYVHTDEKISQALIGVNNSAEEVTLKTVSLTLSYANQMWERLRYLYEDFWIDETTHTYGYALKDKQITMIIKEKFSYPDHTGTNIDDPTILGGKITFYNNDKEYMGYISKLTCTYAREEADNYSTPMKVIEMVISGVREIDSFERKIQYTYQGDVFAEYSQRFPEGYVTQYDTITHDLLMGEDNNRYRYVLEPTTDEYDDTMTADITHVVSTYLSARQNYTNGDNLLDLALFRVDEATYFEADGYLYLYTL